MRQIKIGKYQTGIVGLDEALKETAEECQGFSDEKIGAVMVGKLSGKNYIPSNVISLYASAFLREYKKSMGSPALMINGKVKAVGSVPSKARLREMILEADAEIKQP